MQDTADQIIELYERHADIWDARRGAELMLEREWMEGFLALAPGSDILDIGCGSGQPIARFLIERTCRVTGVDSSPALIAKCRARFPGHEWLVADMRSLILGRQFHGLLAWHSFFHLKQED